MHAPRCMALHTHMHAGTCMHAGWERALVQERAGSAMGVEWGAPWPAVQGVMGERGSLDPFPCCAPIPLWERAVLLPPHVTPAPIQVRGAWALGQVLAQETPCSLPGEAGRGPGPPALPLACVRTLGPGVRPLCHSQAPRGQQWGPPCWVRVRLSAPGSRGAFGRLGGRGNWGESGSGLVLVTAH